jgi:hypothetical protein
MTEFKTVYLIVERGLAPNKLKFWRIVGSAFVCRDGSLNMKLDIHPGLTFNIREAKHPDEIRSAVADTWPETNGKPAVKPEKDIPF